LTEHARAREAFGTRLRLLREQAGLNGKQLADRLGWSQSKISKIETGRQAATADDVTAWASAVAAPRRVREDLVTDLRTLRYDYATWRRQLRRGTAPRQRVSRTIESSAATMRVFELDSIPGLLQTPDYAREMLTRIVALRGVPDDVTEGVKARLKRQEVLYDSGKTLRFLLSEAALRIRPCPHTVQIGQLDRLLTLADLPTVHIAVLPLTTELPLPTYHSFWLFDERLVLVETLTAELALRDSDDISLYARAFEMLWDTAAQNHDATDLITRVITELRPSR
jgi:transcriptional regulator with XRE-family HTH domain